MWIARNDIACDWLLGVVPRCIQYTFIVRSNQRVIMVFVCITEFTSKEAESYDKQKFLIFINFYNEYK